MIIRIISIITFCIFIHSHKAFTVEAQSPHTNLLILLVQATHLNQSSQHDRAVQPTQPYVEVPLPRQFSQLSISDSTQLTACEMPIPKPLTHERMTAQQRHRRKARELTPAQIERVKRMRAHIKRGSSEAWNKDFVYGCEDAVLSDSGLDTDSSSDSDSNDSGTE